MKNDSLRQAIAHEEAQLADLTHKRNESRGRLAALKTQLATLESTPVTPSSPAIQPVADTPTTAEGKISFFRQLFRGRENVFPLLWISSKTGRKGYSPDCDNEWVHGVCEKPRVKCSECPNQAFLPLTDQVILDHLQGRHTIGVYPLLKDETCWFLAADFDKESWLDDVAAFTVDARSQAAHHPFNHNLIIRETGLCIDDDDLRIQEIYQRLTADKQRNNLIFDDVLQALEEGGSPILLTERKEHLEYFADRLRKFTRNLIVLQGGRSAKRRRDDLSRLAAISDDEERLVLATGRYIGEGFDDARLDTLYLALAVSWKGTLIQYAGRLHRLHPDKTEVRIYDYVDRDVPMLARMFERRLRGYRAIGYNTEEVSLDL
jgi:hypothetical protein